MTRKLVVEGGCWLHRLHQCLSWRKIRKPDLQKGLEKWEQRAKTLQNDWKCPRGITSHLLSEGTSEEEPLVGPKVGIGKAQKAGACPLKASDHVTTSGSLLGVPGRWSACAWSVVQLDQDEEMEPMRGMYGDTGYRTGGAAHHQDELS